MNNRRACRSPKQHYNVQNKKCISLVTTAGWFLLSESRMFYAAPTRILFTGRTCLGFLYSFVLFIYIHYSHRQKLERFSKRNGVMDIYSSELLTGRVPHLHFEVYGYILYKSPTVPLTCHITQIIKPIFIFIRMQNRNECQQRRT